MEMSFLLNLQPHICRLVEINEMNQFRDLHDATLTQIFLDWASGDFSADFIVGADQQKIRIIGAGINSFSYSRDFPWGRSVSVNKCQIETKDIGVILTIQMQSGDELIGMGDSFVVSR